MIEFSGVSKRFRAGTTQTGRTRYVHALRDVNLDLPAGSIQAVVGPNGAGKTTLFAVLLGFLRPTTGSVRVDGLEPRTFLRRHGAAFLPERFQLPGTWNVRTALRALAGLDGYRGSAATRRADNVLEQFQLAEHAGTHIAALSRGMLQRLGLAQALLAERQLVVLDEPTAGLDPLWRIRFRHIIDELRQSGTTLLLASHDLAEVERIAQQVVLLEAGRVRQILDLRSPAGPQREYRLQLAGPTASLAEVFPDARPDPTGLADSFLIVAPDSVELSARLAALLESGAIIAAVQPATEALEDRIRRALDAGSGE